MTTTVERLLANPDALRWRKSKYDDEPGGGVPGYVLRPLVDEWMPKKLGVTDEEAIEALTLMSARCGFLWGETRREEFVSFVRKFLPYYRSGDYDRDMTAERGCCP